MLLNNPENMKELFVWLKKSPIAICKDIELNESINNALLLEGNEQQILCLNKYSIIDILYGKYYWVTKFLVRHEFLYGKDVSMEQKQFKIIEEMDYKGIVDYKVLEKIEQKLGYHA